MTLRVQDLTDEELNEQLAQYQAPAASSVPQVSDFMEEPSIARSALVGLGSGFARFGQGVKQAGLSAGEFLGLAPKGAANEYTQAVQRDRQLFEQTPVGQSVSGNIAQFVGEVAPALLIPGGVAGGLARRTATGALGGGAQGLLQFVPEGQDRSQQAAIGGLLGGALPGVGALIGRAFPSEGFAQKLGEAEKLSADFEVPISASDVMGPGAQRLAVATEYAGPVGLSDFRIAQNVASHQAAEKLVESQKNKLLSSKFSVGEIEKIAAGATPRAAAARALLDEVKASPEDWRDIVQLSGKVSVLNRKIQADSLYRKVSDLAAPLGSVPLNESKKAVDSILSELSKQVIPQADAQRLASRINEVVSSRFTVDPATGAVVSRAGTFDDVRNLRSVIADEASSFYNATQDKAVAKRGAHYFEMLKKAVDQDLENFALGKNKELASAWRTADAYYRKNVIPFKDRQLAKALSKEGDADKIFSTFIKKSGSRQEAQKFYEALDEKGRDAVRYGILNTALSRSIKDNASGGVTFSNTQFANSLRDLDVGATTFFSREEKQMLDGFKKLMRLTKRSGEAAENPPTGQRLITALGGASLGASVFNPQVAAMVATTGGLSGALRLLWTTPQGKALLIKASKARNVEKLNPAFYEVINKGTKRAIVQQNLEEN